MSRRGPEAVHLPIVPVMKPTDLDRHDATIARRGDRTRHNHGGSVLEIATFAEHRIPTGSHPSYRHEEPASPTTSVNLLTGGLLVPNPA
jgi:hypothetical protein